MTQIPTYENQLDKIEHKVDQVLDRLTRMEERQNSHAGELSAHAARLDEHGQRIRDMEREHAVATAVGSQSASSLHGRWAAIGAVALVILATIGGYVGRLIAP